MMQEPDYFRLAYAGPASTVVHDVPIGSHQRYAPPYSQAKRRRLKRRLSSSQKRRHRLARRR